MNIGEFNMIIYRGPSPNGRNAIGCRFAFSAGENLPNEDYLLEQDSINLKSYRSGMNFSGSDQYSGLC
jgi:hypothetical protein